MGFEIKSFPITITNDPLIAVRVGIGGVTVYQNLPNECRSSDRTFELMM